MLEIPVPCWTTCNAMFFGVAVPDDVPATIRERV
ncbi:MAG: hypothetical protein H6978_03980 [Gammaproteobacteria bacterium]|nr:hypothetical protein [Gammaproteobacteria bacterium]